MKVEVVKQALNVVAAGLLAVGCATPERNGSGMLPTPLPMPPRPEFQTTKMRCFDSERGLAHEISVDKDGNEYITGNAIKDETCLTPTSKPTPTPTPAP